jgi:hypothetical protein
LRATTFIHPLRTFFVEVSMKHRCASIIARLSPALLIASFLPLEASAIDACHSILTAGFYDEYSKNEPKGRDRSLYAELCSLNYEQAQAAIKRARQSGDDGTLGLTYGLFTLDDDGVSEGLSAGVGLSSTSLSEDRFRQWKAGYCSKTSEAESSQAAEFLIQTVTTGAAIGNGAKARAVQAWSSCMKKREGLTCWASPRAPQSEEFVLNVNWTKTGAKEAEVQPQVQYSYITRGGRSKFDGAPDKRILPEGHKLAFGTSQIPVERSPDKGITATLKVNHAGTEQSCNVFIPGETDFTLSAPFVNRLKLKYPG